MLSLTVVCALITACYCTAVPWADEAERYPYRLRRTSNVQLYTKIYIYFTTKNKISTDFVLLLYFIITSSCNSTGARPQAKTIMNQIGNIMHRRCTIGLGRTAGSKRLKLNLQLNHSANTRNTNSASKWRTARYPGSWALSIPTPRRCKLAYYAAGSPKLAILPLVQPPLTYQQGCGCMQQRAREQRRPWRYGPRTRRDSFASASIRTAHGSTSGDVYAVCSRFNATR